MKITKILALVALFAFASFTAGCGKKDQDKKADPKAQPATPAKPADKPATPAASPDADWEAGIVVTEKLADVIDTNKDDCVKMAEGILAFYEENKDTIEKGKELATKMTPEDATKFAEKYKDRIAAYTAKMAGGGKCMADKAVTDAMMKLAPEPKAAEPKADEAADPKAADPKNP